MEKERLFVYGTLKRGQPLHYLLKKARFLGEGRVKGYALYDLGEYPAARPSTEYCYVWGELYEIPRELLSILDQVEDEYLRLQVEVELENGPRVSAWFYVFKEDLPPYIVIPSGKWEKGHSVSER